MRRRGGVDLVQRVVVGGVDGDAARMVLHRIDGAEPSARPEVNVEVADLPSTCNYLCQRKVQPDRLDMFLAPVGVQPA
jgi:hypothetical protein